MSRLIHLGMAAAVILGAVLLLPAPADGLVPGCTGISGSGKVLGFGVGVEAENSECPPGGGSSSTVASGPDYAGLWDRYCSWGAGGFVDGYMVEFVGVRSLASDLRLQSTRFDTVRIDPGVGTSPDAETSLVTVRCNRGPGDTVVLQMIVPTGEIGGFVSPEMLRDAARARLVVPDPSVGSSPAWNDPNTFGIVGLPTWLWLNDPWETLGPVSESAGSLTVAVAGYPRSVTWVMGDGSEVVCDGPGVAWRAGLSDDDTDCSYIYTSSSADQPRAEYALSATVTWEFEWWINGASQGIFGDYLATTSFTYQVGEIQALES